MHLLGIVTGPAGGARWTAMFSCVGWWWPGVARGRRHRLACCHGLLDYRIGAGRIDRPVPQPLRRMPPHRHSLDRNPTGPDAMKLPRPFSRSRKTRAEDPPPGVRLHVGAGRERLEGWVNLDIQDLPGVDLVADVTEGLDFEDVEAIYAEHFLEHLRIDDAVDFLEECHRVLAEGRWLRLSTPNLEWVWLTHYHVDAPARDRERQALQANRAFHGWRHRFLWNRPLLERALAACGFEEVTWCRYGESQRPEFAALERHETYDDSKEHPHVIIAEARKGKADPAALAALREEIQRELLAHLDD